MSNPSSKVDFSRRPRKNPSPSVLCYESLKKNECHRQIPYRMQRNDMKTETPETKEMLLSLSGPSVQRHPLAVQPPSHSPQDNLQDPVRIQSRLSAILTLPRYRINDIP